MSLYTVAGKGKVIQTDLIREFFRCPVCLSVSAVDKSKVTGKIYCGICEDTVCESMGFVHKYNPQELMKLKYVTPCDSRCTCALGPKCECSCGGENHGSQMMVPVVVFSHRISGQVPSITPQEKEKAIARHLEYKEWLAKAEEHLKNNNSYYHKQKLKKIKDTRVHGRRIELLKEFLTI